MMGTNSYGIPVAPGREFWQRTVTAKRNEFTDREIPWVVSIIPGVYEPLIEARAHHDLLVLVCDDLYTARSSPVMRAALDSWNDGRAGWKKHEAKECSDGCGAAASMWTHHSNAPADTLLCARCSIRSVLECHVCGDPYIAASTMSREMHLKDEICFTCHYWSQRSAAHVEKPHGSVITDLFEVFTIGDPKMRGSRGHGGTGFKITFHDGHEARSTNLWSQGVVPLHLRGMFEPNAKVERTR